MLKSITAIMTAGAIAVLSSTASFAGPMGDGGLGDFARSASPIEKTRLFCYNRYTGRFLHWGRCGGGYRPRYSRPRVYCRNRYTGRFIHWGAC